MRARNFFSNDSNSATSGNLLWIGRGMSIAWLSLEHATNCFCRVYWNRLRSFGCRSSMDTCCCCCCIAVIFDREFLTMIKSAAEHRQPASSGQKIESPSGVWSKRRANKMRDGDERWHNRMLEKFDVDIKWFSRRLIWAPCRAADRDRTEKYYWGARSGNCLIPTRFQAEWNLNKCWQHLLTKFRRLTFSFVNH